MAGRGAAPGRRLAGAAAAAAGAGAAGGARARPAARPAAGIRGGAAGSRISPPSCAAWRTRPDFFRVSAGLETVSPARPFYPARGIAGMTRAAHAAALGLAGPDGPVPLVRPRHRRAPGRRAAVLDAGGQPVRQGGDHRLAGLARRRRWPQGAPIRLWPFEGGLHALLAPGRGGAGRGLPGRGAAPLRAEAGRQQAGAGAAPGAGAGAAGGDGGAAACCPTPALAAAVAGRLRRRCRRGGPLRFASSACSA